MTKQQSLVNRKTNRLVNETSPYLQQHAYNPVDWWSWCPEALEQARKQDKPILLSIGYAACHWCHVMAHESFEDPAIADLMNQHFISIKVDREERPDLDEIYMRAVQAINGHGGWPMTVFLTSELKPFFGGTYFPPVDRYNMPSFQTVLNTVAKAWSQQREQIEQSSIQLTDFLSAIDLQTQSGTEQADQALGKTLAPTQITEAIKRILGVFDRQYGGLGGAPKFPHPYATELVMRTYANSQTEGALKRACHEFIETTLNRMACGGIHDQLGGGFARYSVDSQWLIPHFEKMLYDNAALVKNYLSGYQIFKDEYWKSVAIDCLDFVERELLAAEGGFYSSLDADSEGSEGKFYVWTAAEIINALGKEDGQWFSTIYGISPEGNFEHGSSVLNFAEPPEVLAQELGISLTEFWARLNPLRQKLLELRSKRTRPGTDEKVITSWNALMISAYVKAFQVLGDAKYLQIAVNAMQFILTNMYKDGRLLRTWAKGKAHLNGYLEDYAFVVQALLELASADASPTWLSTASELNEVILSRFFDQDSSSFFYTGNNHEKLILRTKNNFDGPLPSSSSVAAMNLLRLARITDNHKFETIAENVFRKCASQFERAVDQYSNMLCALDLFLSDKTELVLVLNPVNTQENNFMLKAANSIFLPNIVTAVTTTSKDGTPTSSTTPKIAGRLLVNNKATAYLCRNYTCQQPVTDPVQLINQLANAG